MMLVLIKQFLFDARWRLVNPWRSLLQVAIAILLWHATTARGAAQTVLVEEQFNGTSANPNWTSGIGQPGSEFPCLTSAPTTASNPPVITNPTVFPTQQPLAGCPLGTQTDPIGQGVLRLTSPKNDQAGFVFYRAPVPAGNGLVITFDIFEYGGSGADGLSFFVVDGTQTLPSRAGAFGGSLGYAQKDAIAAPPSGAPGLQAGYVGIGFDAYGFYSNPNEGRIGGPGARPNAIAVRGAQATNYNYLTGIPFPIFIPGTNRTTSRRQVRIIITPNSRISVEINSGSGYFLAIPALDLSSIPGQGGLPSQIIFGFGGSTGNLTNFNEIRDFRVTTVRPNLSLTKTHQGDFTVGTPGTYTLTVQNSPAGGATLGAITVTDPLPTGFQFVSATGTNWTCTANGQLVTCTYTGASAGPGASLPPISLTVLPTAVATNIENVATVATPQESDSTNNTARDRTNVVTPQSPALRFVKRITRIFRNGSPLAGANFSSFVNDPNNPNDDSAGWSQLPPIGVFQLGSNILLQSGDEVEYTLYVLSEGGNPALNVKICDQAPPGTQLLKSTAEIKLGTNPSTPGGQFFSPLEPLPSNSVCNNPINPNGTVIFNFGDVPAIPGSNFGFGRFRVRIQ